MIGRNIKKYRLLMGMSMRDMAKQLNISHQTIKKYEDDVLIPTSERLIEIAKLFGVNISDLVYTYDIPTLTFNNFRKKSTLNKKKEEGLHMLISDEIASYLEILNIANEHYSFDKKNWTYDIYNKEDIEKASLDVRKKFGMSDDCVLDNLIDKLENNNFLVLEIDFEEKFYGFCEYVDDLAFIILSSNGYERNRFTLAHELGHLILNFKEKIDDKEKEIYCDYFAACLLLPKKAIKRELEFSKQNLFRNISLNELMFIAKEYKVSLQAVIMRLHDLKIIDDNKKRDFFILLSKNKLRKKQLQNVDEHPSRKDRIIFRLEAEKIIETNQVIRYLGLTTDEYFELYFSN